MVLTSRQLAILRAALQFFDEEFCPHPLATAQGYFPQPFTPPLTASELQELRDDLRRCLLQYAGYDPHHQRLVNEKLFPSAAAAQQSALTPTTVIVTVLMAAERA